MQEEILRLLLVRKHLKSDGSPLLLVSTLRLTDGTFFTAAVLLTSCYDTLRQFGLACAGLAQLATSRGAA